LASNSYSKGGTLHVVTNRPGARIEVDGFYASGIADFKNLPYGIRTLRIDDSPDYAPISKNLTMG
jgi:hypothetical protein